MRWDRLPLGRLLDEAKVTLVELARRSGEHRRQLVRWKADGVDYVKADELAGSCGLHPLEVWGDGYLAATPWPEFEVGAKFGGRPLWYRASGAADFYGDPRADRIRRELRKAAA